MALPPPAYALKIQVAPDSAGAPGTFASPSNQLTAKMDIKGEQIDITQLNSAGYRQRIAGLIDVSGSIDGLIDFSDTGQTTIRTAILTRVPVWLKLFITATNYIQFQANCEGFGGVLDPAQASKLNASFVMAGTGTTPLTIA